MTTVTLSAKNCTPPPPAPLSIDPRLLEHVELLKAALIVVFPEAASHLSAKPLLTPNGVLWMAYQQAAWRDVSWGWENVSACPPQQRSSDPAYRPCPHGGRFVVERTAIGD